MKDWSGKTLCFECIKSLSANINIGLKNNGRCQRCHRVQTVFTVTSVPHIVSEYVNTCPECAHSDDVHANACQHSEIETLNKERDEIVRMLQLFGLYEADTPLTEQLEKILQQFPRNDREEDPS
jgi:hypothetical protein